ncbi:hypothetical protein acdb102_35520 [Acidothermaceae bacterium B102]|nr:hypothetical protein acdb102_35520 [Acidothermaceae bacterium B102]
MLGSGSRVVPSLLAVTVGLGTAGIVGAASYLLLGAGTVGPPQSPRAAALRYAHMLHVSDDRELGLVVCRGTDPQAGELDGAVWRLDPGQTQPHVTTFAFTTTDGQRHLRVDTSHVGKAWCVSGVQPG